MLIRKETKTEELDILVVIVVIINCQILSQIRLKRGNELYLIQMKSNLRHFAKMVEMNGLQDIMQILMEKILSLNLHPYEYKQWVKAVATGNEADFRLSRCSRYLSKANTRFTETVKQIKKLALKDIVKWMKNSLTEWRLTGKNPLDKS